ncbi:hypothetical protein [Lentilactobacillus curieae]|uniref:hypothetical protein n=1 Tax=Lentilactobacillus curieae TaxID=1138822 RepID=UPI001F247D10|nr:hypothetical protein [Lentilactobacillus curieae]
MSPSLDGMLFNKIVFAGGYPEGNGPKNDWIYSEAGIEVPANSTKTWEFIMADFTDRDNFYEVGNQLGHPIVTADPMIQEGTDIHVNVQLPAGLEVAKMTVTTNTDGELITTDVTDKFSNGVAAFTNHVAGEHKVEVVFTDGTSDMLIYNVTKSLADVLNDRVEYISNELYQGAGAEVPYSYKPLSNQGESLGKLSLVLQQNLLNVGHLNSEQVQKVELSVVNYVRPKWFIDGDFFNPRKLYGDFYRCMDFEYIGHVFYLLSKFDDSVLKLNSGKEYLSWAADVFDLRVNPDLHTDPRAKEESQMLGVFFLYINDLLADLKAGGLTDKYEIIKERWNQITAKIDKASDTYQAAITEHFYDNAGFGPASGALSMSGHKDAAKKYASLLRANIGYSNDFRAQAPDRWWEALSYMMHSLWGGITSAASQIAYDNLGDAELLKGAYRSTVAMLYLYDTEATATDRPLKKGEAASTFSIAGPNINRPDLSRNRFGQSAFAQDGGIFAKLFPEGDTGYADWDMGEEMVAYLNGFGQKTYVVGSGDDLKVINGRLEQVADDEYIVHSYAPYPTEYIFQDGGEDYRVAGSDYEDKVLLKGGKFTQYVGSELSK